MAGRRAGILVDGVQRAIVVIRGQRVMLDADLAALYGVPTKALVQAVGRNRSRFPTDFMFRLTPGESARLRIPSAWRSRSHRPHSLRATTVWGIE